MASLARITPSTGGLLLCVAAVLLCISIPPEPLLRMFNPALPAPDADGRPLPAARLIRQLETNHPDLRVQQLTLAAAPGRFAQVRYVDRRHVDDRSEQSHHALANPVNGTLHTALRGQHWLHRADMAGQRLRRTLGARLPATLLVLLAYGLLCWQSLRRGGADKLPSANTAETSPTDTTLVCYASQTGGAEALARDAVGRLQAAGRAVELMALNALDATRLDKAQRALFVVSTHGEGDPPDNGALFARRVLPTRTDLSHLEFGLLAMGDSAYETFCGFGRALNDWLRQQGARAGFAPVEVDNHDTMALTHWHRQLHYFATGTADGAAAIDTAAPYTAVHKSVHTMTLQRREHLNPGSPGAPAFHISLTADALPHWVAGDLAVLHIGDARREYSIASLPACGSLQLLVRQARHGDGQLGLGSGLLTQALAIGEPLSLSIRKNRNFHGVMEDLPVILIGNGTGLAGLHAHLLERAQHGHHRNWLMFGERSAEHDRYHDAALQAWQQDGHLTHLDRIFSRPASQDASAPSHTGYVQDLLQRHAARLRAWVTAGAHLYVCGSLAMGQGVDDVLRHVLGDTEVDTLVQTSRYHRDIY
ncbi:MAG: sulfite reductase subunit alpha [Alcanivorax sp.]|nr:sulfite reductase subunit alpha [Alcanivorax sp.]